MKKRLVLLLVAITVLASATLVGCGSKDSDWSYIQDKGELIVGLDDTFAPMGFRDKNNKLVGFDVDMAKAVGKELNIKIKFQPIDWDSKESELKSKNIDCIWNGMSATKERQEKMSLSNKYLNNKIIIMSLNKNINAKSEADLKDIKIGTQADSAALETMQANKNYDSFKDNISEYKSYDDAILDMKAGRIDCIAIDQVLGEYKNKKTDEELYVSDFDFGNDFYAIGFRKEDTELTNKVNDALKAVIDSGQAEKISKKWFGKNIVIFEDYK